MAAPTNILDRTQTVSLANPTPPTNSVVTYQGTPPTPRGLAPAVIAAPDATNGWLLADPVNGAASPELAGFAEAEGTEVSTSVATGRVTGHSVLGSYTEAPNQTHPSSSGAAPVATPVLTLTSGPTDTTPDFTLTGDLVLGDVVRFHYSTSASFASVTEMTNTIDAGEDAANSIIFTTGALALGTWYFRARIDRPVIGNSDWSNTVTDTIVAPTYTGPGDIVSGATAFWGLRAYNSAYAASLGPCLDLGLTSTGASVVTINFASNGYIDTAAVAAAIAAGKTKVMKLYDQVGTNHQLPFPNHTGAPRLQDNAGPGGNTLAMYFDQVTAGDFDIFNSVAYITVPQPYSYLLLGKTRSGAAGLIQMIAAYPNPNLYLAYRVAAGNLEINSGGTETGGPFSGNAWHAANVAVTSAASGTGVLNVDGSTGSGTSIGTTGYSTDLINFGGGNMDGWLCEVGIWPLAFDTTQQTNLNTNMHTRWGF